ncbi:hypothetical protein [Chelativorans sp. YIM 93263]|uniref:hypothetical protein n=1 Tax=Chelativorans sp. YIM 93263 TaxID=2906648 RepID=UPI00237946C3|nr:hypothetical protein [Chelativorans sp. YIM 93263]
MSDKAMAETADEEPDEGLPSTAGALVGAANSKPFTALFGPAFDVLGVYWGERMQEWVNSKRAKNINAHVEKVKTVEHIDGEAKEPTERQAAAMLDWAEEAQKVDPERENDLAALWQGILGRIYKDDETEELVALLKQMNRSDARVLLDLPSSWFPREELDPIRAERFQRLGLIFAYDWRQATRRSLPTTTM